TPDQLRLEPGASGPAIVTVRGPRMLTGGELDRAVAVQLRARRIHSMPELDELETEPELVAEAGITLRQRPLVSRGLLTALILAAIVALWALVFLFGILQVMGNDPQTKTAPASFFPPSLVGGAAGAAAADAAAAGEAVPPAGAMPRSGLLPPGVGGEITGVVRAASNEQPVGRILVEAFRESREGPVLVSSAATQSDGQYSLAGLFPTDYRLRFSATGFDPVWFPGSTGREGAERVPAQSQGVTEGIDLTITGKPAQVSGRVEVGESGASVPVTVAARMVDSAQADLSEPVRPQARVTTTSGDYVLTGLPGPATYELSFVAEGYRTTTVTTRVGAGERRLQPSTLLGAGEGRISGRVTSGSGPLGGVTVSTTVAGEEVVVVTPTVGAVGSYALTNLPTPGTYVLTFSAPGHGSRTTIVGLAGGRSETRDVLLRAGTGSITGRVSGPGGNGLGGVQVFLGGATLDSALPGVADAPITTTLTTGDIGTFSISGLAAPGDYTLTFVHDGFAPETVPVTLKESGPPDLVKAQLQRRLGGITGRVTGPRGAYVGATVTATNGRQSWSTASSAAGGALSAGGGYLLSGLEPGTYSVTVTAPNLRQQTAFVTVQPGQTPRRDLTLRAGG
ncbi:carboxypeptidase-like regulatory domain-containing protein, partial [Nocardioides sp.]|uniref:carboxypeptidase-like regulatory domain-containing protein n=1 Tax=Nocardioides sp. TaxID=35761 RepID=UPI002733D674